MTLKGRPAGPFSSGRALDSPAGSVNDDLRLAVEAIDSVHRVGHLPRIPMEFRNQLGMNGRFDFDDTSGEAIRILIDRRAPHRTFVAVHEIGHFLDLAEFGEGSDFGSAFNAYFDDWSFAVSESEAYKELVSLHDQQPSAALNLQLRAEELWSRSYVQYVAVRSGSSDLLEGLKDFRIKRPLTLHNSIQWEDNDFENIAKAVDALFAELGWRE